MNARGTAGGGWRARGGGRGRRAYDELDDVERGAAVAERGGAEVEAAAERGEAGLPELGRQRARDVPGAAVQRQRPPHRRTCRAAGSRLTRSRRSTLRRPRSRTVSQRVQLPAR
jgi:hypothetical protein